MYHLYVIRSKNRDKLKDFLLKKEIATGVHYPVPVHMQPSMDRFAREQLALTEQVAQDILSLPLFPNISEDQIHYVSTCIKEWLP